MSVANLQYWKRAEAALELIGRLYQVEKQIRQDEPTDPAKLHYRSHHSPSLADAFFALCQTQRQRVDKVDSEPLAKALKYAENHQDQLKVYLGDPAVPMDSNHLERALRAIPMGRKPWLFNWSEVGAKQFGVIQSLMTT